MAEGQHAGRGAWRRAVTDWAAEGTLAPKAGTRVPVAVPRGTPTP